MIIECFTKIKHRYAWGAREGGHWTVLAASGIPFGIGAFSLFVSSASHLSMRLSTDHNPIQLSTINYLVDVYQSGAAASGASLHPSLPNAPTSSSFSLPSQPLPPSIHISLTNFPILALAANGTLRFTLGATFPLFTLHMYESLGVHWAGSIFAFLSLLLLPIPWLLLRYGHRLRAASRFAN